MTLRGVVAFCALANEAAIRIMAIARVDLSNMEEAIANSDRGSRNLSQRAPKAFL